MPTKQETFDTVVAHLRRQGCRAKVEGADTCRYRLGELRCAAGCLIPDDRYSPHFEGKGVAYIGSKATEVGKVIVDLGHDLPLVMELQACHDALGVWQWESRFDEIARKFGLTYTPPGSVAQK